MASTLLDLREVTTVPNLRVANLKTDDGVNLLALAVGTDIVHIVPADGSLEGFGGFTVVGPGVTTYDVNWGKLISWGIEQIVKGIDIGGGSGSGSDSGCITSITTTLHADGTISQTVSTNCPKQQTQN